MSTLGGLGLGLAIVSNTEHLAKPAPTKPKDPPTPAPKKDAKNG